MGQGASSPAQSAGPGPNYPGNRPTGVTPTLGATAKSAPEDDSQGTVTVKTNSSTFATRPFWPVSTGSAIKQPGISVDKTTAQKNGATPDRLKPVPRGYLGSTRNTFSPDGIGESSVCGPGEKNWATPDRSRPRLFASPSGGSAGLRRISGASARHGSLHFLSSVLQAKRTLSARCPGKRPARRNSL